MPAQVVNRLELFPDSTRVQNGCLSIAGQPLDRLAEEFGTPLYVYDRQTMDNAAAAYRRALADYGKTPAQITYAGKAFLCKAIARWVESQDMWLDCTGETEIHTAVSAGLAPQHILAHGVNKSLSDLTAALKYAGTIVLDNLPELERLAALLEKNQNARENLPQIWLRLLPGLAVQTHHVHTQTGQHDSKFGMTPGEVMQAAQFCREHRLTVQGLHFHQGSNFRDPSPLIEAIALGLDIAAKLRFEGDWHFSPGGGWGVSYHEDEMPQPNIEEYVRLITGHVKRGCRERGLELPHLHLEPGRSLIARAGVALYRIGAVKKRGERTWLLVDGGMTDNPRHAMYASKYTALPVLQTARKLDENVDVAGPFCESGDILIEDLPMPKMDEGELIAVPVSGAYQLSMSSNYNGARRPAVVWLEQGSCQLIQRRESIQDLTGRDLDIQL